VALAKANFNEGEDRLKRTVRAVYQRKKKQRLEREDKEQQLREMEDERVHDEHRRKYGHSDHFS
jgi:phospholipase A2